MTRVPPGRAVVESLVAEGVGDVFGVVGSSYAEVLDAFYDRTDIRFISARHEQGAAFMAVGYARALRRPGVCMATNGPGVTNLVTGIAEATLGYTPLVAITGAASRAHVHRGGIQEVDHVALCRPITRLALQVPTADRIPELVRQAFRVATSAMGGVLLDVPRDLYQDPDVEIDGSRRGGQPPLRLGVEEAELQRAVELLRQASSPVLVVGGGVKWSDASDVAGRLADLLGAPIVTSYGNNDAVPDDHPLFIGSLGRCGAPEAREVCRQADVVLALGTRLGHFSTFWDDSHLDPAARIIQVALDAAEIGRVLPVAVALAGDARTVATQLLGALERGGPPAGRERARQVAAELRDRKRRRLAAEADSPSTPIKPQRVYVEMKKVVPDDAVYVLDTAATPGYGHERLQFAGPGTLQISQDLACVGSGFPMAVGVKLAQPERTVVCISGDGGFLFNSQELETALREGVRFVTLVLNNNAWGAEKAYQRWIFDERYVGANISNPRLDLYAESFGAKGLRAERAEDIAPALEEALAADVAAIVEIPVDPDEIPFPARAADIYKHWKPPGQGA